MLNYSDFNNLTDEVRKMVQMLIPNLNAFGWKDFGEGGNACWNPHVFANEQERQEDALMLAATKYVIPYNSHEHILLSAGIAAEIGCRYCTYPWLIQAIAYALEDLDYDKLKEMITVTNAVQSEMKRMGIKTLPVGVLGN
jgi:hypothetical protein